MAVKIRFARLGCKHRPFYRIIVTDSQAPRDGKHIQVVGFYDPLSGTVTSLHIPSFCYVAGKDGNKYMGLKYDAVKHWLSVGAQPTDAVRRILLKAGLISPPSMVVVKDKGGPSNSGLVDAIADPE
ncbi:hypothetical protein K2173_019253 [Erythroxylum novogranatense]|uniref:Ribosomal protein S16 n=1 Tax=Erythroxylum novogranatense TaxID=1862640 RepID=A0AAV8ST74_9ROSI|nr:hypothetical protein K2173_019253 [Erythroxylum novogranatense]